MKFGMDSLKHLMKLLYNEKLKYPDTIIIGDNSSGKSLLLKLLVQSYGETDALYFIDAVNRNFDPKKVMKDDRDFKYTKKIVMTRIQQEYFNQQDSFNCFGTWTERIEQIYASYEEKLQALFEKFTHETFRILPDNVLGEVEFQNGKGLLSSGYQAIVRIFLELLFYQEKYLDDHAMIQAIVIIDELDEFLSPGYAFLIVPFLKEQFPQMNFIVTTHSCDLICGAQNANLIVLDQAEYEVMDSNDYQSVSEVQLIFERIFGRHESEACETEHELRRLLNNKINQVWTENDQALLEKIAKKSLTASQQLIYRQIAEW